MRHREGIVLRAKFAISLVLLFLLSATVCLAQGPSQQFTIRVGDEDFDHICPAIPIPTISTAIGEVFSLEVSILAVQNLQLSAGVVLPDGTTTTIEELGAFYAQLPGFVGAQEEASGFIEWVPFDGPEGLYIFRFAAQSGDPIQPSFSVCEVPVELTAGSGGGGGSCVLTNALDGLDNDGIINFGDVATGESSTGQVLLSFSAPASEVIGEGQLLRCLPPGGEIAASPGSLLGDFLDVQLIYSPQQAGELDTEIIFYHAADAEGEDLCDPELAALNPCARSVVLIGRAVDNRLSGRFENSACAETPQTEFVLRNGSDDAVDGLSIRVDEPLSIAPLGSFSADDFSLGAAGSVSAQRRFRVSYPEGPFVPFGESVFVESGGEALLEMAVPTLRCVSVEPTSIDFGDTPLGQPVVRTVTLTNSSDEFLVITPSVSPADLGFSAGEEEFELEPFATRELGVEYLPASIGPANAELRFDSDSLAIIADVSLSGNGAGDPGLVLSYRSDDALLPPGSTVSFPPTSPGATSARSFTIVNDGEIVAESLRVFSSSSEFGVSPDAAADLAPGTERVVTITFAPQQTGQRSGTLRVAGDNFAEQTFVLQGEGVERQFTLVATGLEGTVSPLQMNPYPAIGLELTAPASDTFVGTLEIEVDPGELPEDPSVQFLATGRSIPFRIDEGGTIALFDGEPDERRARFQVGSVAARIVFHVRSLSTESGGAVSLVGGSQVGSVDVPSAVPGFTDAPNCSRTGDGVELSIKGFSTQREITGVSVDLAAAPNAELSFTNPPEDFANAVFQAWFTNPDSIQHGGAFSFSLPISMSDVRALGSASLRLRNGVGWSQVVTVAGDACQ